MGIVWLHIITRSCTDTFSDIFKIFVFVELFCYAVQCAYVWGVRLQACPFVQPCHFDKIDNTNTRADPIFFLG